MTKDLLLDLVISPERRWSWKDREEFDQAIELGIVAAELRTVLFTEADRVVAWSGAATGPFDPIWRGWRPDPTCPAPVLPDRYRPGGELWGRVE